MIMAEAHQLAVSAWGSATVGSSVLTYTFLFDDASGGECNRRNCGEEALAAIIKPCDSRG